MLRIPTNTQAAKGKDAQRTVDEDKHEGPAVVQPGQDVAVQVAPEEGGASQRQVPPFDPAEADDQKENEDDDRRKLKNANVHEARVLEQPRK